MEDYLEIGLWVDWAVIGVLTGISGDGAIGAKMCIEPKSGEYRWIDI